MVWDFTCPDTLAPSNLVGPRPTAPGKAANKKEEDKLNHYSSLTDNYWFIPITVETLGTMGASATAFVKDLSNRLITATGDRRAGHYFRQRLGLAVQRGNALSIMNTMSRGEGLSFYMPQ